MDLLEDLKTPENAKAYIVSAVCDGIENHSTDSETQNSLRELRALLTTLQIPIVGETVQVRKKMSPATALGKGKLEEVKEIALGLGADLLVFDFELSASQVRNIKELTELETLDRCQVILEIFARHARTKESKIQIEISKLEYMLPRLSSLWTHFSRQKGGVGVRGGEGEQQIELDRRIVRDRIAQLKHQLKSVAESRKQQGKNRKKSAITAALVGYTNAGKSSLMNRLCQEQVLEEDKLFATLDSTYRMLTPNTKPPLILVDTVGFLSNLPNTLIGGFRSTLDSALEADLLLLVCDVSDNNVEKHIEVTKQVLKELNVEDKDTLVIFNKKDQIHNNWTHKIVMNKFKNSFLVSSHDKEDMKNLRHHIINYFLEKQNIIELLVPYEDGAVHSSLHSQTNIIESHPLEKGIFYQIRSPDFIFEPLGLKNYCLSPEQRKNLEIISK